MESEPVYHQPDDERRPLLGRDAARTDRESDDHADAADDDDGTEQKMGWVRQNQWIVLAIASGACAAFNGVFAKLYAWRSSVPRLLAAASLSGRSSSSRCGQMTCSSPRRPPIRRRILIRFTG